MVPLVSRSRILILLQRHPSLARPRQWSRPHQAWGGEACFLGAQSPPGALILPTVHTQAFVAGQAEAGVRVPRRKGTAGVALRGQCDGKGPGVMGRKAAG